MATQKYLTTAEAARAERIKRNQEMMNSLRGAATTLNSEAEEAEAQEERAKAEKRKRVKKWEQDLLQNLGGRRTSSRASAVETRLRIQQMCDAGAPQLPVILASLGVPTLVPLVAMSARYPSHGGTDVTRPDRCADSSDSEGSSGSDSEAEGSDEQSDEQPTDAAPPHTEADSDDASAQGDAASSEPDDNGGAAAAVAEEGSDHTVVPGSEQKKRARDASPAHATQPAKQQRIAGSVPQAASTQASSMLSEGTAQQDQAAAAADKLADPCTAATPDEGDQQAASGGCAAEFGLTKEEYDQQVAMMMSLQDGAGPQGGASTSSGAAASGAAATPQHAAPGASPGKPIEIDSESDAEAAGAQSSQRAERGAARGKAAAPAKGAKKGGKGAVKKGKTSISTEQLGHVFDAIARGKVTIGPEDFESAVVKADLEVGESDILAAFEMLEGTEHVGAMTRLDRPGFINFMQELLD